MNFVGGPPLPQSKYHMADGRHLENRYDVIIISADNGPIWMKFGTLQSDTPITAKCSRSKPEIELQQSTFQRFAAQYYHLFLLKMVSEIVAVSDVSL